jgi:hypothetical protein
MTIVNNHTEIQMFPERRKRPLPAFDQLSLLSENERVELASMNIPIEDVDSIYATPHGLFVETGRKQWMKARLGTISATDEDIRRAKQEYNVILGKVRRYEKTMTTVPADLKKHRMLMDSLALIYETIVKYGHEITKEEARNGFKQ